MSWTAGLYFTKKEEENTKDFLDAQELDKRQIITIETFIRQKIVSAVYFYTCSSAGLAAVVFFGGLYLFG